MEGNLFRQTSMKTNFEKTPLLGLEGFTKLKVAVLNFSMLGLDIKFTTLGEVLPFLMQFSSWSRT